MKPRRRVLLNAEPFGFGPAAAIAAIAEKLAQDEVEIGYIGKAHTLDLQQQIPYAAVYDISGWPVAESLQKLQRLSASYDVFLTAMDVEMAGLAKQAGMRTVVYDALAWYWKDLEPLAACANLYIAQNFLGVQARLSEFKELQAITQIVPPITTRQSRSDATKVLINLGGLQNPFWEFDDTVRYAELMLKAIVPHIDSSSLVIITSAAVAAKLDHPDVQTLDRRAMQEVFRHTKYAFMTPGLGNIYDAAAYDIPTIWLPPANDSQGQQATLLAEAGLLDVRVDWQHMGRAIQYRDDQPQVLRLITQALHDKDIAEALQQAIGQATSDIKLLSRSRTAKLLDEFGSDGVAEICDNLREFMSS